MLNTDGLIERRSHTLTDGLTRLADEASRHRGLAPSALIRAVLRALSNRLTADDSCLLALRRAGTDPVAAAPGDRRE